MEMFTIITSVVNLALNGHIILQWMETEGSDIVFTPSHVNLHSYLPLSCSRSNLRASLSSSFNLYSLFIRRSLLTSRSSSILVNFNELS